MSKSTSSPTTAPGKPGAQYPRPAPASVSRKPARRKHGAAPQAAGAKLAPEQRQQLVAQAAYFIAERRGFAPGNELEDWLQAEAEIEALLKAAAQ